MTALLLVGTAAVSRASVLPGEWYMTGGAGWVNGNESLTSVNSTFGDNGPFRFQYDSHTGQNSAIFSAQLFYQATPRIGLGFHFLTPRYRGTERVPSFREEIYLAAVRYMFMPEREWNPYLIAGIGAADQSFHTKGIACGNCGTTSGPLPAPETSFSVLGPAASFGAGIQGETIERLVVGFEAGLIYTHSGAQEIPSEVLVYGYPATRASNSILFTENVAVYAAARIGFNIGGRGRR